MTNIEHFSHDTFRECRVTRQKATEQTTNTATVLRLACIGTTPSVAFGDASGLVRGAKRLRLPHFNGYLSISDNLESPSFRLYCIFVTVRQGIGRLLPQKVVQKLGGRRRQAPVHTVFSFFNILLNIGKTLDCKMTICSHRHTSTVRHKEPRLTYILTGKHDLW